jgi:hypothetical protein
MAQTESLTAGEVNAGNGDGQMMGKIAQVSRDETCAVVQKCGGGLSSHRLEIPVPAQRADRQLAPRTASGQ